MSKMLPECRDERQRPPGLYNRWHNIQPDYTISPRVYLRALLAVRADSGAGPAERPSKYPSTSTPSRPSHPYITYDRSADLYTWLCLIKKGTSPPRPLGADV